VTGDTPELSVVVPVYNEARRVERGVEAVAAYLAGMGTTTELVVVDDGSTDETVRLVRPLLPPGSRLLIEPHRGKGGAVRTGMLHASGAYVIFMDVDLATPARFIEPCLTRLKMGPDVVIGSRRTRGARFERHQARGRELLGQGYSLLSRLVTGVPVSDFTCGFKGFRRAAAQALFSRHLVENWSFDAEVLFLAHRLHLRVEELPVVWHDDAFTKVRLSRDIVGSLGGLVAVRVNHLLGRYRLQ
jgi:glycosyltransferase involved in cell wall biosynthesis